MSGVNLQEILDLEKQIAKFHNSHAAQYGDQANCSQVKCIEARMGLAWLKQRLANKPEGINAVVGGDNNHKLAAKQRHS